MAETRRVVAATPVWPDTLLWYARAVSAMRQRPVSDPTSWTYQASIHGTDTRPPSRAWNSCQHGGWYFLAWHRAYLYYFERIVRAAVVSAGGPANWALPYWDYENPTTRALPRAFRELTLPGGGANALRATARDPQVNRGARLTVSSADARRLTTFSSGPMRGFGGAVTPSAFQANGPGKLELNPHGDVHVIVGGGGWMSRFQTAALDPIFWLHHCNLDRIWAEWARTRSNPTASAWLNQSFPFFDETGAAVTITPARVVNTIADLDYTYDTLPARVPVGAGATASTRGDAGGQGDVSGSEPVAAGSGPSSTGSGGDRRSPAAASAAGGTAEPQLVGASATPLRLQGDAASVAVSIDAATAADMGSVSAVAADSAAGGPPSARNRMYLQLDDISAESAPNVVYGVYLTATRPDGSRSEEQQIGTVSFFGAEVETTTTSEESHALQYVFDVTDTMPILTGGVGIPGQLDVQFRPISLDPPEDDDVTDVADEALRGGVADEGADIDRRPATMRIGRVALFTAPSE